MSKKLTMAQIRKANKAYIASEKSRGSHFFGGRHVTFPVLKTYGPYVGPDGVFFCFIRVLTAGPSIAQFFPDGCIECVSFRPFGPDIAKTRALARRLAAGNPTPIELLARIPNQRQQK